MSKSPRSPEAQIFFFFFATGINKLISHLQKCIDGNGSHTEKEMATHSSILCLENPRDGEAWWAAVYGVAQSRTRLK